MRRPYVELDRLIERLSRKRTVHPAVRTGDQLTLGERSADKLRNGMGSWTFVFAALAFLAVWMLLNARAATRASIRTRSSC